MLDTSYIEVVVLSGAGQWSEFPGDINKLTINHYGNSVCRRR
jgi:hypothetical protein